VTKTSTKLVATNYNPTLKSVDAVPVKLLTLEGESLVDAMLPSEDLTVAKLGQPLPEDPKYIMCPNPIDEDSQDVCIPIKREMHPPVYADHDTNLVVRPEQMMNVGLTAQAWCRECEGKHTFKGFKLEVPDWWAYNSVLQCQNCRRFLWVELQQRGTNDA
jgi:hypothetical protein